MKQSEALEILKMGHNVLLTGAAGCGKTYLLNQYIAYLQEQGAAIGITASTGIAATHMGGVTIHSWSGLGIKNSLGQRDLESLQEKSYLWKRFEKTHVLIIDEISMLHHFRLDLVDKIARTMKGDDRPFGGMQVILCGDFFQLPPVARSGEPKAEFAYKAQVWSELDLKICYLEEQYRQNDQKYLTILNAVRDNEVSEDIVATLMSRTVKTSDSHQSMTRLYTHNVDVDAENARELAKLPGEVVEYQMFEHGNENIAATLKKGCLAPEVLQLKKNARVMMVKNNFEEHYANGTIGTVVSCDEDEIVVKDLGGRKLKILPASWKVEEDGKTKAEIIQYPIRLAWAITVHKSQGMSLDQAQVDLSRSFERGMGYVALSRLRSLEGLTLKGINQMAFAVNEEVQDLDHNLRIESQNNSFLFRQTPIDVVKRQQQEFITCIAPEGAKKPKKADTVLETKKLLDKGRTLPEIAKERNLTLGTIIGHLEKLQERKIKFDLSGLTKDIPSDRLEKVRHAFKRSASKTDHYPLSAAKNVLGSSFSYEEIRLARLLIID